MKLVIVESPTKARTIQRFLPAGFVVKSSYGHVRDLPKGKLGVDTANDFEPSYVVPIIAKKRLQEIKKILPKAEKVILASDEDREGEAIAWHLIQALKLSDPKKIERIVFHEITKSAIENALKNPRELDMSLVDAQQARRILDRLVGYGLSPFLWKKVAKGLSAGRVQSVAVRLIVEREREIQKFKSEEYWTIEALLAQQPKTAGQQPIEFTASLIKQNDKSISKLGIKTETEAKKILDDLNGAEYQVADIIQKETRKHPAPPFTTSTLQQQAANKFGFSAKQTMQIAQQLYEGVEIGGVGSTGLITYMRTDSVNLAAEALNQIKNYITDNFGPKYLEARFFKTKSKGAQEAHEAIRPTDASNEPDKIKEYLTPQQFKLYDLIWRRTIACQMAPAILAATSVDIAAKQYIFRATGSQIKFDGYLKIYNGKIQETILPPLSIKEYLELIKLSPNQHFTQPPPRYGEAALIKILEEYGIGRPSTYAPTISTIQDRNYTQKDDNKKFFPTEIGFLVSDLLVKHFPQIVDYQFTAAMEEDLDTIAEGKKDWVPMMKNFYGPFKENLDKKYDEVETTKPEPEKTDKICPTCGAPLLIRTSRFGKFYACSAFPKCRYTENIKDAKDELNIHCPKCLAGQVVARRTKRKKIFYGCSRYPECDFASWDKPIGQKCPECGAPLVEKKGKIICSNKECKYKEKS
ncbi:MAG: topoisomerase protein [Parcubacteria group bacterium GW2011_GWA2_42_11]|nr:MAG: topoisomerase protein [Parcubacteria group bacterium GW2011_GWA2_42_11]KKT76466.1 MAG: topoisomerase protein [Parcubacteria group bacterium GW2011_GWF2_44_7]